MPYPARAYGQLRNSTVDQRWVRKRDVSFGARSPTGVKAWDVVHTRIGTAQLLGVNVLHHLQDRFSGACQLPSLADLVRRRATDPTAAAVAGAACPQLSAQVCQMY